MPIRWVINPVLHIEDILGYTVVRPKVATLLDLGRLGGEFNQPLPFMHSSVIDPAFPWCLSFVRGVDFTTINAAADCVTIFDDSYEDTDNFLAQTPRVLGWSPSKMQAMINRIRSRTTTSDLTADVQLWQILQRLGQQVTPSFAGPSGTWVKS